MRKILFALAILPLLAFVGCSDNIVDDTPKIEFAYDLEMLYGEWRATSVEVMGVTTDLTIPEGELMVTPTYVTFKKEGVYESEGILGNGTGKYMYDDKKIITVVDNKAIGFEMTSLSAKTAEIKIDSQALGLDWIPAGVGMVKVILTKDYQEDIGFEYDIAMLYGKWRATSVEVFGIAIDLTLPEIEEGVPPTYVTFAEGGAYTSEGILGDGTGKFVLKGKLVVTMIDAEFQRYNLIDLASETAKIEIDADSLGIPGVPEGVGMVTVVLTKQ